MMMMMTERQGQKARSYSHVLEFVTQTLTKPWCSISFNIGEAHCSNDGIDTFFSMSLLIVLATHVS